YMSASLFCFHPYRIGAGSCHVLLTDFTITLSASGMWPPPEKSGLSCLEMAAPPMKASFVIAFPVCHSQVVLDLPVEVNDLVGAERSPSQLCSLSVNLREVIARSKTGNAGRIQPNNEVIRHNGKLTIYVVIAQQSAIFILNVD